jgi:hypothetical protein
VNATPNNNAEAASAEVSILRFMRFSLSFSKNLVCRLGHKYNDSRLAKA